MRNLSLTPHPLAESSAGLGWLRFAPCHLPQLWGMASVLRRCSARGRYPASGGIPRPWQPLRRKGSAWVSARAGCRNRLGSVWVSRMSPRGFRGTAPAGHKKPRAMVLIFDAGSARLHAPPTMNLDWCKESPLNPARKLILMTAQEPSPAAGLWFPWSSASTKTDSRPMDASGTSYQFRSVAQPLPNRCTTVKAPLQQQGVRVTRTRVLCVPAARTGAYR